MIPYKVAKETAALRLEEPSLQELLQAIYMIPYKVAKETAALRQEEPSLEEAGWVVFKLRTTPGTKMYAVASVLLFYFIHDPAVPLLIAFYNPR
jgi:hypothetical protein